LQRPFRGGLSAFVVSGGFLRLQRHSLHFADDDRRSEDALGSNVVMVMISWPPFKTTLCSISWPGNAWAATGRTAS